MKTLIQPNKGDYSNFFATYLKLMHGENYEELILQQIEQINELFQAKGKEWAEKAYEFGKWTPKELLGHMIDTERIMTFRALCFARGEKASLPGFDQDPYVEYAKYDQVALEDLLEDFKNERMALLSMMKTFPKESFDYVGIASGNPITPRALLWIIPGHFLHHYQVLISKY